MDSYSSHITPYLMAAAEGTLIGGLLQTKYASKWAQVFENHMLRYDLNNITAAWEGDQSADMAASSQLWHSMVEFFKCTSFEPAKNQLSKVRMALGVDLEILLGTGDDFATMFANESFAQHGPEEARVWGELQAADQGTANQSVKSAVGMMAVSIWRFKCRCQLHVAMLSPRDSTGSILSQSLGTLIRLSTSAQKISEVFEEAAWPARIVLHDLSDRDLEEHPLKHLASKARNRILLQCEGFGGFRIKTNNSVKEIVTFYDGDCGIFIRDIDADEKESNNSPTYTDVLSMKETVPYYGNLTFGAGKEMSERKILGWVAPSASDATGFKLIGAKSFLDKLAPGPTGLSKIILYLNWYIGGMSSWYHTSADDTSGSLMREEPTRHELVSVSNAMKIDVHFRIGDVVACSRLPKDGCIRDLVHHSLDEKRGDIVVYKRKKNTGLAYMTGFEPQDCQFQALDTLVNKQNVQHGILGDLANWVDEKYGQKK